MRSWMKVVLALAIVAITSTFAQAAEPATRPVVPALLIGAGGPQSFVAEGVARFSDTAALGFQVAVDGKQQRCVVYDLADNTPLLLSDGQQTLVYDVVGHRIVRLPDSRANVRIDWDATKERPMAFSFGVDAKTDPAKLDEANSFFRLDRFAETAKELRRADDPSSANRYVNERATSVDALEIDPARPERFTFRTSQRAEPSKVITLTATHINQPVPASYLAFPDLTHAPAEVRLTTFDAQQVSNFMRFLRDGQAWMVKFALAGGPEMRAEVKRLAPTAEWDELVRRDAALGASYRQALTERGIIWSPAPTAATRPATQP